MDFLILYTAEAAQISMTQMVYNPEACSNNFIKKVITTINEMNKLALENYCTKLIKVRTEQAEATCIEPWKRLASAYSILTIVQLVLETGCKSVLLYNKHVLAWVEF